MADYQELFDHMIDEHDLTLLDSEMEEIIRIVRKMIIPDRGVSIVSTGDHTSIQEIVKHLQGIVKGPTVIVSSIKERDYINNKIGQKILQLSDDVKKLGSISKKSITIPKRGIQDGSSQQWKNKRKRRG